MAESRNANAAADAAATEAIRDALDRRPMRFELRPRHGHLLSEGLRRAAMKLLTLANELDAGCANLCVLPTAVEVAAGVLLIEIGHFERDNEVSKIGRHVMQRAHNALRWLQGEQ